MGYTSNVKILMGKPGFEKLQKRCLASKNEEVRKMVTDYCTIDTSEENGSYPENSVAIEWSNLKWYNNYDEIKAVNAALTELDSLVEEFPEGLKDYFYKMIKIGEDNATEERTNDESDEFVYDFYVNCSFSI